MPLPLAESLPQCACTRPLCTYRAGRLRPTPPIWSSRSTTLEDQLRQSIADASDELRSPVTAIRGFGDVW